MLGKKITKNNLTSIRKSYKRDSQVVVIDIVDNNDDDDVDVDGVVFVRHNNDSEIPSFSRKSGCRRRRRRNKNLISSEKIGLRKSGGEEEAA